MLFGALICLGGCASHGCDDVLDDSYPPGSTCREQHLLYQNDMLQAKLLISEADRENYELAEAMLRRARLDDTSGEAGFYQAVLLIREQQDSHASSNCCRMLPDASIRWPSPCSLNS